MSSGWDHKIVSTLLKISLKTIKFEQIQTFVKLLFEFQKFFNVRINVKSVTCLLFLKID